MKLTIIGLSPDLELLSNVQVADASIAEKTAHLEFATWRDLMTQNFPDNALFKINNL